MRIYACFFTYTSFSYISWYFVASSRSATTRALLVKYQKGEDLRQPAMSSRPPPDAFRHRGSAIKSAAMHAENANIAQRTTESKGSQQDKDEGKPEMMHRSSIGHTRGSQSVAPNSQKGSLGTAANPVQTQTEPANTPTHPKPLPAEAEDDALDWSDMYPWLEVLRKKGSDRTEKDISHLMKYVKKKVKNIVFLKSTSKSLLRHLCSTFALEEYEPGDIIFRQGDIGEKFYVILQGSVGIYIQKDAQTKQWENVVNSTRRQVAQRLINEKEKAMPLKVQNKPAVEKAVSTVSEENSPAMGMTGDESMLGLGNRPDETAASGSLSMSPQNPALPRSAGVGGTMHPAITIEPHLSSLASSSQSIDGSADLDLQEYNPINPLKRESVIQNGKIAPVSTKDLDVWITQSMKFFNITNDDILQDDTMVQLRQKETKIRDHEKDGFLTTLRKGQGFGEVALTMENCKRTATVAATEICCLMTVNRESFSKAMKDSDVDSGDMERRYKYVREENPFTFLETNTALSMRYYLHDVRFTAGQVVYMQNDPSSSVFFIVQGEVMTKQYIQFSDEVAPVPVCINRLSNGSMFGEEEAIVTMRDISNRGLAAQIARSSFDEQKKLLDSVKKASPRFSTVIVTSRNLIGYRISILDFARYFCTCKGVYASCKVKNRLRGEFFRRLKAMYLRQPVPLRHMYNPLKGSMAAAEQIADKVQVEKDAQEQFTWKSLQIEQRKMHDASTEDAVDVTDGVHERTFVPALAKNKNILRLEVKVESVGNAGDVWELMNDQSQFQQQLAVAARLSTKADYEKQQPERRGAVAEKKCRLDDSLSALTHQAEETINSALKVLSKNNVADLAGNRALLVDVNEGFEKTSSDEDHDGVDGDEDFDISGDEVDQGDGEVNNVNDSKGHPGVMNLINNTSGIHEVRHREMGKSKKQTGGTGNFADRFKGGKRILSEDCEKEEALRRKSARANDVNTFAGRSTIAFLCHHDHVKNVALSMRAGSSILRKPKMDVAVVAEGKLDENRRDTTKNKSNTDRLILKRQQLEVEKQWHLRTYQPSNSNLPFRSSKALELPKWMSRMYAEEEMKRAQLKSNAIISSSATEQLVENTKSILYSRPQTAPFVNDVIEHADEPFVPARPGTPVTALGASRCGDKMSADNFFSSPYAHSTSSVATPLPFPSLTPLARLAEKSPFSIFSRPSTAPVNTYRTKEKENNARGGDRGARVGEISARLLITNTSSVHHGTIFKTRSHNLNSRQKNSCTGIPTTTPSQPKMEHCAPTSSMDDKDIPKEVGLHAAPLSLHTEVNENYQAFDNDLSILKNRMQRKSLPSKPGDPTPEPRIQPIALINNGRNIHPEGDYERRNGEISENHKHRYENVGKRMFPKFPAPKPLPATDLALHGNFAHESIGNDDTVSEFQNAFRKDIAHMKSFVKTSAPGERELIFGKTLPSKAPKPVLPWKTTGAGGALSRGEFGTGETKRRTQQHEENPSSEEAGKGNSASQGACDVDAFRYSFV